MMGGICVIDAGNVCRFGFDNCIASTWIVGDFGLTLTGAADI